MYLLSVDIGPERGNAHSFTAFCYPAVLPGWSVTLLFPRRAKPHMVDGQLLSVVFALREVISANSVEAALNTTYAKAMRYGYSLNLANLSTNQVHQVEVAPGGQRSEIVLVSGGHSDGVGAHANKYLRLPKVPEYE